MGIFCRLCLSGYFLSLISDGCVDIKCPSCGIEVNVNDVKEIVNNDTFQRFDRLLLERSLDKMSDISYCPRQNCNTACVKYDDKLAICSNCSFAFCTICNMSAHGDQPCKIISSEAEKILDIYEAAISNHDAGKDDELTIRYGSRKLKEMMGERATIRLINETTINCPTCNTGIEKIDGCNKMTCTKCRTYFCFICGEICNPSDPYAHYRNTKSKCYGQLFLGVDDGDELQEYFEMFN